VNDNVASFEVFTEVWLRVLFFWDMTIHHWVIQFCHFEGMSLLHVTGSLRPLKMKILFLGNSGRYLDRMFTDACNCLFGVVATLIRNAETVM
jgi:hypothetical protein